MEKIKYYGISLGIGYLIGFLLLFISSVILAYTNVNDNYLDIFVFISLGVSVLCGSTFLSKKIKEKGIITGAVFGIIYIILIYLFTVIMHRGLFITNTLFMYIGLSTLTGMIGGILGVNI